MKLPKSVVRFFPNSISETGKLLLPWVLILAILGIKLFSYIASLELSPQESIGSYEVLGDAYIPAFQDGTRLTKYRYTEVNFKDNPYFQRVGAETREEVLTFVEDFAMWADALQVGADTDEERKEFIELYDYDVSMLSDTDYYYVEVRYPESPLENYTFYLYDTESMVLYRMESIT